MSNYPTGWKDDHQHLLFDIGYAYALLARTRDLLAEAADDIPYEATRIRVNALLENITEFMHERLQEIDKIYTEGYKIELPK